VPRRPIRMGLALCLLTLGLIGARMAQPLGAWEGATLAATLAATAILVSLYSVRVAVIRPVARLSGSVARTSGTLDAGPIRLSDPDAPGRPRPRAPDRAAAVRPS